MRYRRARAAGGTYFFTVVTFARRKILCESTHVTLLRNSFRHVMKRNPFTIDAMVLLPEHLHCVWTLPDGDRDFSTRWRLIKSYFSRRYANRHKDPPSTSRQRKKEQIVWQRRFWEHLVRDEQDFIRHVEYIHYNPVKHGLVKTPNDWPYSSFQRYVKQGLYRPDWGADADMDFDSGIGSE